MNYTDQLEEYIDQYDKLRTSTNEADLQELSDIRAKIDALTRQGIVNAPRNPSILTGKNEPNYKRDAAKNLQDELGLSDPIRQEGSVPTRWRAAYKASSSPDEGLQVLQSLAGEANVIPGGSGRVLVRQTKGGETFWSPLDPTGLDVGDFTTDIAGYIPETVTSALIAARAFPGPQAPFFHIAGGSAQAALGGQTVGAIQDALVRTSAGLPARWREIIPRRGFNAAIETIGGSVLPGAGSKMAQAGGVTGDVENVSKAIASEARKGQSMLRAYGIDAPLTAGESTGARYPQETERMMEVLGRLTASGQKIRRKQGMIAESVRDLDEVSSSSANAVRGMVSSLNDAESAIAKKSREAYLDAASDIQGSVSAELASLGKAAPDVTSAGGAVRASVAEVYDRANIFAKTQYQAFNDELAKSNASGDIVTLKNTGKLAKEIKKLVLKKEVLKDGKVVKEPLAIYAPMLREVNELLQARGTRQSIDAVRSLRSRLLEASRRDQNFSEGVSPATARRIANALSEDITESVGKYSGPGADMLRAADLSYRASLEPFESNPALSKMINTRGNGGFANDSEVVSYFSKGGKLDELVSVGDYIGPEQYQSLRRAIADDVFGSGVITSGGREFADLGHSLSRMEKLSKEYKTELFGSEKKWRAVERGMRQFKHLNKSKGIFMNDALPSPSDLSQFIREVDELGAFPTRKATQNLAVAINEAKKRQNRFGTSIASQIRKGQYGMVSADYNKFLDDFVFSGQYSESYVRSTLNQLPQNVLEDVQSAVFQRVFARARIAAESTVDSLFGGKNSTFDINKAVIDVFGSREQSNLVRAAVGEEAYKKLYAWITTEAGIANARRNVGGIGSFSREQFSSIGNWPNLLAKNAAGQVIFSDSGQRFLSAVGSSDEVRRGVMGAIAGGFVRVATSRSGRAAGMVVPAKVANEVWNQVSNWNQATEGLSSDQEKAAFAFFFSPESIEEDEKPSSQ